MLLNPLINIKQLLLPRCIPTFCHCLVIVVCLLLRRMSGNFVVAVRQFLALTEELIAQGVRKKQIAQYLQMYPSVLSVLMKPIFPEIAIMTPESDDLEARISQVFAQANNISEKRIRHDIRQYITQLEILKAGDASSVDGSTYITQLIRNSPQDILGKLVGIYECYYISSFGYKVKKEPFLIRPDKTGHGFVAQKGNRLGPAALEGFAYLTNAHILTMQMLERETILQDHFMAHFIMPPSYTVSLNLLKGMAVSVTNSYMPIGRRVVLKKIATTIDMRFYESIETTFYDLPNAPAPDEISRYLSDTSSLIEFLPVPRPAFDESDLKKEIAISRQME